MGLNYYDTEPSPLPGRAAFQFATTVRSPLMMAPPNPRMKYGSTDGPNWPGGPHTQPQVHESWPMGLEAAQPCRGWCERRGCDRGQCRFEAGTIIDDDQAEEAYRRTRRDNTDDTYKSRPMPLHDPMPRMVGEASANALGYAVLLGLLVWGAFESYPAIVRLAEKWLPVVRQWAMGWF